MKYLLKIADEGGGVGRSYLLAPGRHVVGSHPECEVAIEQKGVSRRHAEIEVLADGGVVVADLDSKNGTFVNERRVRRAAVVDHAEVGFGSIRGRLQAADEAVDGIAVAAGGSRPAPPARRSGQPAAGDPSTQEMSLVSLLLVGLRRELAGARCGEAAALALAGEWLELLPAGALRFSRRVDGGEAVVAEAARPGVEGGGPELLFSAGGWTLALLTPEPERCLRLRALFELALELLAADGEGVAAATRSPAVDRPPATDDRPPPPGTLDPGLRALYRRCARVARGEISLLILGESGVGKEVMARWLHARSRRADGPFRAVNCAALPQELLEAELFGIERGVATGVEARAGLLEQAAGGTLFLDEIGDMPAATQAKVLRVLESTTLYRVGGRRPVTIDVRFLAATNRDLERMIADGGFRRDLYHRLAGFVVPLPPLRARQQDAALFAAHFFQLELEKLGGRSPGLTRGALAALVAYDWPGNLRQLRNEIAKAVLLLAPGEALGLDHLSEAVRSQAVGAAGGNGTGKGAPLSLGAAVERAERQAFEVARIAGGGDPGRACEILGISRTSYYRKLKELGLGRSEVAGA